MRAILIPNLVLLFGLLAIPACGPGSSREVRQEQLAGTVSGVLELSRDVAYELVGTLRVRSGGELRIEAGTTIRALPFDVDGSAPSVIVEPGGKIYADGTAARPITFTSALADQAAGQGGLWGGLIILGRAPVNQDPADTLIEGIPALSFGGDDPDDSSGILRYVRIWYGGREIGEGNEINGMTLGGVGRGTILEHCEVAFNLDDGFEFFGGTVDGKYLSVVYVGDDAFDVDWGYQGRLQFVFALLGQDRTGRGYEMDNNGDQPDSRPRSYPVIANSTLIGPAGGSPSNDGGEQLMYFREGVAGDFRNHVVLNGNNIGIAIADAVTARLYTGTPAPSGFFDSLFISPTTFVFGQPGAVAAPPTVLVRETDPLLRRAPEGFPVRALDPRPQSGSPLLGAGEKLREDGFFKQVEYSGAFGPDDLWLKGWSILDAMGVLP